MAQVKVTEACYLNDDGYKAPEEGVFEYNGPEHHCVVLANGKPYKAPSKGKQAPEPVVEEPEEQEQK